jgi:hypothetical protein
MRMPAKDIRRGFDEARARDRAALAIMEERECSFSEAMLVVLNGGKRAGVGEGAAANRQRLVRRILTRRDSIGARTGTLPDSSPLIREDRER